MLGLLHPSFEGVWRPGTLSADFARKLAARVRTGLLPAAKAKRNRYEILTETDSSLHFRSTTLLTGANIGWNDVELRADPGQGRVTYRVEFWAWTRFCVLLGLALGAVFAALVVLPVLTGTYLFSESYYPSQAEVLYFALPMMIFWCLVWPWILVAMHKRPARRGFEGLLREVNESPEAR
ncbi:MAG: hypothetical protein ACE5GX_08575 [Thermoanaerobaculia bacterium]